MSRKLLYVSVFTAGLLLALACGGNGDDNATSAPTSTQTTTDVATVKVSADAGCTAKSAFAGNAGAALVLIDSCTSSGEVPLNSGGRMTVDTAGEGYLDFTSTDGAKRIWVLHNSELLLCTQGPDQNPTVADCVTGFGVWANDNPDTVVVTDNAAVTLVGTHVLIGYLPEINQTIVVPFDGEVLVNPERVPGEGELVETGAFWTFGDFDERLAGIEEFPEIAAALGIESWVVSAVRLVGLDGFPPPGPLLARDASNVLGVGAFGDPEGGDILINGIFWEEVAAEQTITALMGSRGPIDVLSVANEFDPARLEEYAAERGFEEIAVFFDSASAEAVAGTLAEQLSSVGFGTTLEGVDPEGAREILARVEAEGQSAILVTGL
jgi:hypothetical protein